MNEKHVKLLDLAALQSGVLSRAQARAEGLTEGEIDGCLANGLLVRVADHVYRVRGAPQLERMASTAAVLGADGVASHVTAAGVLRLGLSTRRGR